MNVEALVTAQRHDDVIVEFELGVPGEVNPLAPPLLDALADGVRGAVAGGARVVIVTGVGRSFAAGADLRTVLDASAEQNVAYGKQLRATFDLVAEVPVPTIAAINGFALGGGLELALACSLRLAAADAVLGLPETRLGLIPSAGGLQRVLRTVHRGLALELLLTGATVDAARAAAVGLVDRVVPADELRAEALRLARRIATGGPRAVRAVIELARDGVELPLDVAQDRTDAASAALLAHDEWREGVGAFLERRTPTFAVRRKADG